jgi:DNA replication protein DnaC
LRESVPRLAERARAESWTHEEFLAACLQREVAARESHGGEGRIRAARFPSRKSLEEFDFDHARGLKRDVIAHLGTLDFTTARDNVLFLGPPGTGKTHLATGLAIRACQGGHRVLFATASEWVARLADAHHAGRLQAELVRLGRYPALDSDDLPRPRSCSRARRTVSCLTVSGSSLLALFSYLLICRKDASVVTEGRTQGTSGPTVLRLWVIFFRCVITQAAA